MTMIDLITTYVGNPSYVVDIPTLVVYTTGCIGFIIILYTPIYIITSIIRAFQK